MILTDIGYGLSGLLGLAIIGIGTRFLLTPIAAATSFGVTAVTGGTRGDAYLAVKGVRDIASGIVALILLSAGVPHLLGGFMLAAAVIPIGDAIIVRQHGGPRAIAYGVHGATAAVMLATAAILFI